jgi:chlorophyll synthase
MCGVVSSGVAFSGNWLLIIGGIILAGPLVCAMSQAINDWHDRHVDALNEPDRPIPSGRVPGRWGLYIAVIWTALSLVVASILGEWVVLATAIGLFLAWAYSAPPLRLKLNGWYGNAAVAISYEGLAWFTGAAVMLGAMPDTRIVVLLLLYSAGAHGIMTLNDFKSISGDKEMGVRTIPVQIGAHNAARLASMIMAVPQVIVIALMFAWGLHVHGVIISMLLAGQIYLMFKYLMDRVQLLLKPREMAAYYNAFGVTLYVLGMLTSAIGIGSILASGVQG